MTAPTINSVTPAEGLSLGGTFVVIDGAGFNDEASGGSVKVYFGDEEILIGGVVSDTKIVAQTPPGIPGPADLRVENIGSGGAPVEPTTLANAFTYLRPSLATPSDRTNDSALAIVTRTLLRELKRMVIEETWWKVHPDYADAFSASEEQEKQQKTPSLILQGPTLSLDRFYSQNGAFILDADIGTDIHRQPVTVRMDFQVVGYAKTKGESYNLWVALSEYLNRTPVLTVPNDGDDPANGTTQFDIGADFDDAGTFGGTNRHGVYQFTQAIYIRGVHVSADKMFETREVEETFDEIIPIEDC